MKKINETDSLNELIALYQQKQEYEWKALKEQFHITYESLKPVNLINNLVHEVAASPEIKNDLISNAVGLGAGFLSKKFFGNYENHPVKRVFGIAAQLAIAKLVSKYTEPVVTMTGAVLKNLLHKIQK